MKERDTKRPIVLVSGADEKYALPLAASIRSAIDSVPPQRHLEIYVLDGGITEISRQKLKDSWSSPRVTVHWLQPSLNDIADLVTESYLSLTAYARLFMPLLLPRSVDKLIYLDADLIVLKNLEEMWNIELGDASIAAVNDYHTPYLNTREACGRATYCDREVRTSLPVPNYRELGLSGTAPYFNSGVMVVNLAKWREMEVPQRAFEILRANAAHVRYCDQYALNVLFSEKWRPLDLRWNQICNLRFWPGENSSAFSPEVFRQIRDEPWIVHFTWINKPWMTGCNHPATNLFFQYVDRTAWRGWRPPAHPKSLRDRYRDAYTRYRNWYRKSVAPWARSLKQTLRGKRKAA